MPSSTLDTPRIVPMRLQRFLARAGVASRRKSEDLMTAGRVQVNGQVVTELGSRVDPSCDIVTVDGLPVTLSDGPLTLMLNKPANYLTTMSDPHGRPCVASLVPADEHPGLFPIGRLDGNTTGLLLFTTNGKLGNALLHPSYHVNKSYIALVAKHPSRTALRHLREGIELEDGPCAPAEVFELSASDPRTLRVTPQGIPFGQAVLMLTIHEGRKHQVKRMCEAVGCPVIRLHRETFGPLELGDLAEGSWRALTAEEVASLEAAARAASATLAPPARSQNPVPVSIPAQFKTPTKGSL